MSILENGVVVGATSKGRFAIGRSVRRLGSEHFANSVRAHMQRKGPSNTMRITAMAAAFASLFGVVLALLVASL